MDIVDIVVPVYSGYETTVCCLEGLLNSACKTPFEVVVVYDAGPDPALKRYVEGLAAAHRITLLENAENRGFVASVNRGMRLHPQRDVVLLNSDTLVANDWLDRMLECAGGRKIATVTPFSNNAEICSFPNICRYNPLPAGWTAEAVDRLFARSVSPAAVDIPTAIGFCMLIKRKALDEIGEFNEALFGRGYGEENDFCRRAAALGWRNVLCTNVFVYHEGGVSFGAEKQARVNHAMRVIDELYPDYHALVHHFIKEDAPRIYRVQAQLAAMNPDKPRIMMVMHNLDGGTLRHVRELAAYVADQAYVFILRMPAVGYLQLTVHTDMGALELMYEWPAQRAAFYQSFRQFGISHVHVHHVKGIEELAIDLLRQAGVPYDVTLHDYYFINGNPTLADKSGQFCTERAERDRVCAEHSPVPLGYSPEQWRALTGRLLAGARRVFSPSHYAAGIYAEYFPDLAITVLPHPDWEMEAPYPPVRRRARAPGRPLVVGVLGALGLEKGADILEKTALLARKQRLPLEFHLIGYAYRKLDEAVIEHGAYRDVDLPGILSEIDPHLIWFPCQWPETYSYTLSACLRGGFPALAPATGAFVERLQGRPSSWLQPFPAGPDAWLERLAAVLGEFDQDQAGASEPWSQHQQRYASCYKRGYVPAAAAPVAAWDKQQSLKMLEQILVKAAPLAKISRKEKLLRALIKVRAAPGVGWVTRTVPFAWQRRLKRLLSDKALHEVGGDLLG